MTNRSNYQQQAQKLRPTVTRSQLEILRISVDDHLFNDSLQEFERQQLFMALNVMAAKHDATFGQYVTTGATRPVVFAPLSSPASPVMHSSSQVEYSRLLISRLSAGDGDVSEAFASLTFAEQDICIESVIKDKSPSSWTPEQSASFNRVMAVKMQGTGGNKLLENIREKLPQVISKSQLI